MVLDFLSSHSHKIKYFHPNFFSFILLLKSLLLFFDIFVDQNSVLVLGSLSILHTWPCQKQPFTNMTFLFRLKTRSGVPGNFFECSRYRKPAFHTIPRTIISGFVSLLFIFDINKPLSMRPECLTNQKNRNMERDANTIHQK